MSFVYVGVHICGDRGDLYDLGYGGDGFKVHSEVSGGLGVPAGVHGIVSCEDDLGRVRINEHVGW
jgi:hypothetical protein